MRLERNLRGGPRVILSHRNILALLHKVGWEESARTISGDGAEVMVEPDDIHYRDREPGEMHPKTEEFIKDLTLEGAKEK